MRESLELTVSSTSLISVLFKKGGSWVGVSRRLALVSSRFMWLKTWQSWRNLWSSGRNSRFQHEMATCGARFSKS